MYLYFYANPFNLFFYFFSLNRNLKNLSIYYGLQYILYYTAYNIYIFISKFLLIFQKFINLLRLTIHIHLEIFINFSKIYQFITAYNIYSSRKFL